MVTSKSVFRSVLMPSLVALLAVGLTGCPCGTPALNLGKVAVVFSGHLAPDPATKVEEDISNDSLAAVNVTIESVTLEQGDGTSVSVLPAPVVVEVLSMDAVSLLAAADIPAGVYVGGLLVISSAEVEFEDNPGVYVPVSLPAGGEFPVEVGDEIPSGAQSVLTLQLDDIKIVQREDSSLAFEAELYAEMNTLIALTIPSLTGLPSTFVHPGLYYSTNDLAFMRWKIAAKAEPWYSAWEKAFIKVDYSGVTPHPVALLDPFKWDMGNDARAAEKEALQWALTGNPANAAKAIEILNAWSYTLTGVVPGHDTEAQAKLYIGWYGQFFANAAELLRYANPGGESSGWDEADIQQFRGMMQLMYSVIENFIPAAPGNWAAAMMDSMMCIGVFLDDHAMFERAITHYLEGELPYVGLLNSIYPTGQNQESGHDQCHVQMDLGHFVALSEIAWKQGVDLYGAYDNRLLAGLEYTAKFMLGNDVPYTPETSEHHVHPVISEDYRGMYAFIWEAPYQHYVYRKGMEMPFTRQVVLNNAVKTIGGGRDTGALLPYRPEAHTTAFGIGWGTLTMYKGPEDPQAAKKSPGNPAPPKDRDGTR